MPRSSDEVLRSMQDTVESVDPSIDVRKGPIYESALLPWAPEIATNEADISHLGELYQMEKLQLWKPEEVEVLGRNFGQQYGQGTNSQGYLTFVAFEIPADDIPIPTGTLAATEDSTYVYQTIEPAVFYAASASAYYISSRRRYEIKVAAEAVASGPDYDVRPNRINVMLTPISGITSVFNEAEFSGGFSDQTISEFALDLRELPLGNSAGSPGGLQALAIRVSGGVVEDSAVVTPADIGVYERLSDTSMRFGLDLYIIGSRMGLAYDTKTTVASEVEFVLDNQPVINVSSVLVSGAAVSFTFVPDTEPSRRGSPAALDKIVLASAPGAGQTVTVTYTYNKLIADLQSECSGMESQLFGANTLVRAGKLVTCDVEVAIASYGAGTRKTDVEQWITYWFQDPSLITTRQRFYESADPAQFIGTLESEMSVSVGALTKFNRPDRATQNVQTIVFAKNEYPTLNLRVTSA